MLGCPPLGAQGRALPSCTFALCSPWSRGVKRCLLSPELLLAASWRRLRLQDSVAEAPRAPRRRRGQAADDESRRNSHPEPCRMLPLASEVTHRGVPQAAAPSLPSHYRSSRDFSKFWPAGEVPAAARRPCTALAGASLEGDGHCRTFALLSCLYILSPIKRSVLPNLSSGEWFPMFLLVPRGQNDVLSALCSPLVTLNQHKPAPFLVPVL